MKKKQELIAKIQADDAFLDMARNGARIQLGNIFDAFPELRKEMTPDTKHQPPAKGDGKWTPQMRKRHSAMMKARWAAKRRK